MTSAFWPSRVCGMGDASSHKLVCTGSDASAETVTGPMNRCASSVMMGATCAPASTKCRHSSTALYAAIPPEIPRTIERPCREFITTFGVCRAGLSRKTIQRLIRKRQRQRRLQVHQRQQLLQLPSRRMANALL